MKYFLVVVFTLIFSASADAKFFEVSNSYCDSQSVPTTPGQRIYFDPEQLILGLGFTADNGCLIVDFYSVIITSSNSAETVVEPTSGVGRRNSCNPQLLPFEGPPFISARFVSEGVNFYGFSNCSRVFFKLVESNR